MTVCDLSGPPSPSELIQENVLFNNAYSKRLKSEADWLNRESWTEVVNTMDWNIFPKEIKPHYRKICLKVVLRQIIKALHQEQVGDLPGSYIFNEKQAY